MTNLIHPSAIIEPGARIGANVRIGPFCHIGPRVTLEDNVALHAHVVVAGNTIVGAGTEIFPFASIGHAPQDLKFHGEESQLVIGKNNKIREHVTMNPGTEGGGGKTIVGDNGLFMMASHVAHDCIVGDNVILANNATLAGHVVVGDHVVIGGLAAIHQFIRIGAHAVIGGVTGVDSDVIPYGRVRGERGSLMGLNLVGLERRGFTKDQIKTLQRAFNQLFDDEGTMDQRIEDLAAKFPGDSLVMDMVSFARGKTRFPLCQPPKKAA